MIINGKSVEDHGWWLRPLYGVVLISISDNTYTENGCPVWTAIFYTDNGEITVGTHFPYANFPLADLIQNYVYCPKRDTLKIVAQTIQDTFDEIAFIMLCQGGEAKLYYIEEDK